MSFRKRGAEGSHAPGSDDIPTRAPDASKRSQPPDAYEAALRLLGQRSHSTAELAQKLARRGCAGEDIGRALRRLRELGYLDDRAYADRLVERRTGERGRSAIAAELARKGVPRELAAEALAGMGRDDQLQAARRLTARFGPLEPRRVAARLQRRGFGPDVIRAVLEDLGGDDL